MRVTLVSVLVVVGCSSAPSVQPPAPAPASSSPVAPAAAPAPEREDFERAAHGQVPPDWVVVDGAKDIRFAAAPGDTGTVLEIDLTGGSGSLERSLDVARYRGKRLLIGARGRCEIRGPRTRATASVGVDVSRNGPRGFGDRARTLAIESPAWQDYQAIADVAADATRLDLVVGGGGTGTVRIDDITITVIGDAGAGDEPPRPLEGRALDNVVAFARLYGIVRYFHPGDEAAALDADAWERFVVRGVRAVESAADAAALRAQLAALFAPIAPAVAIHLAGESAPAFAAAGPKVRWSHRG
ncbi:MAG TPA: hypothetical protein VFD36_25945, partial [Kofleriaceae bacterium]|nr:hypothetical protein [Kofleriaceae bacterium]